MNHFWYWDEVTDMVYVLSGTHTELSENSCSGLLDGQKIYHTDADSSVVLCIFFLPVPLLCFSSLHPTLHRPFLSFRRTVNIWMSLFDCCEKRALSAHKLDTVSQYEAPNPIATRAKLPSIWFAEIN